MKTVFSCFGVVVAECFIQNTLLVNGVISPHVTTVHFHTYLIAFICLLTQLLPKYYRVPTMCYVLCWAWGLRINISPSPQVASNHKEGDRFAIMQHEYYNPDLHKIPSNKVYITKCSSAND